MIMLTHARVRVHAHTRSHRCTRPSPAHGALPRYTAQATCNKFDAAWVRQQWTQAERVWDEHMGGVLTLIGHASDGDGRRRKLQLEDYRRNSDDKYTLAAPGFLYAAHRRQSGARVCGARVPLATRVRVRHSRVHTPLTLWHVYAARAPQAQCATSTPKTPFTTAKSS